MPLETTGAKQGRGRFAPGTSGNPSGRPKGAKGRATLAAMALLEGEAESLSRKAVEMALAGDSVALRICMERVCPAPKDRALSPRSLTLPPLESGTVAQAHAVVISAVVGGRLTPLEGRALSDLLDAHRKAVEVEDLERRLVALEGAAGGAA